MSQLLYRAWMLSKHRYNPKDLGSGITKPVRETKPHALSHANTETTEEQENMDTLEREARRLFDALTPLDREILRLAHAVQEPREVKMPFPASMRDEQEKAGWFFVESKNKGRIVMMVKSFAQRLTHSEIGQRVGLTAYFVRKRLQAMTADLCRFAVMRGWV